MYARMALLNNPVRLREMRLRMQLSQRQLARQAGVANATISQIEAGEMNPTVSMLKRVLDGIPVNLSGRLQVTVCELISACTPPTF